MKTLSPLLLCLCAVLMAAPQFALADDGATTPTQSAPTEGGNGGGGQAEKLQHLKDAMAQLDLTDTQKQQIKQIRATVTDKTQRRQQVMAVLTPEQKQKLIQILMQYRNSGGATAGTGFGGTGAGAGAGTPSGGTGGGTSGSTGGVAGDGSDLAPGAN
jgi:Spy/CpxP family protein refolding chaperone